MEGEAQVSVKWDKTYGGSNNDVLQYQQQTSDGGLILGGTSNSPANGNKSHDSRGQEDFWIVKLDAAGNKQWDKTYGGSKKDFLQTLQQTSDGGYMVGGYSNSPVSGDKSVVASVDYDYWVIKLDALGRKQWDRCFGGPNNDFLVSIQQTTDKGYILGGTSSSPATSKFGVDKSNGSKGEDDYWIVKLTATGKKEWDRTIGGRSYDYLKSVRQTKDGGYILGGYSHSSSSRDKTGPNKGFGDYWIVKVSSRGLVKWNKTIGGSQEEILQCLETTKDGGFILGGTSNSPASGNKSQNSKGETDFWIVKMDGSGAIVWDKTIGGKNKDNLRSIKQTSDGGFIMGGYSISPASGNKSEASNDDLDFWVVKINSSGTVQWDKTLGGRNEDGLQSVIQVNNGRYVLGGYSISSATEDKKATSKGSYDFWLINILAKGESSENNSGNYTLKLKTTGAGTISRSLERDSYINGSVVSLTANPASGYRFSGWSGDVTGIQNPLTITMNANKNIVAVFAPIERDIYEAENAAIRSAVRTHEHAGYRGEGYVDFKASKNAVIRWVISDQKPVNYELTFRYSNASGKSFPLKILVNGATVKKEQIFKPTKKWTTWSTVTVKTVLKAGENDIRVMTSQYGGPNIDYLQVTTSTNGAGTVEIPMVAKQAENTGPALPVAASAAEIKAYPNPFSATTNFEFSWAQEEEYTLTIYDLNGEVVKSFPPNIAPANETVHVSWETELVKIGIYVAKLKTKNGVQTLRIIKN